MIGPRREWRKGWAVQTVRLLKRDAKGYEAHRKKCRQDGRSSATPQRGYVKLWRMIDGEWVVVSRALTQKRAMARARQILQRESGDGH